MRKYLLDSSVILEGLLLQAQAAQVQQLLMLAQPGMLCISDFSLHSIGLILTRANLHNVFIRFVEDMILKGNPIEPINTQFLCLIPQTGVICLAPSAS
jgi:hypothetical protein